MITWCRYNSVPSSMIPLQVKIFADLVFMIRSSCTWSLQYPDALNSLLKARCTHDVFERSVTWLQEQMQAFSNSWNIKIAYKALSHIASHTDVLRASSRKRSRRPWHTLLRCCQAWLEDIKSSILRTLPLFGTAHTFCPSSLVRDIRVAYSQSRWGVLVVNGLMNSLMEYWFRSLVE